MEHNPTIWVTDFLGDVWGLQIWPNWSYHGNTEECVAVVISGPDFLGGAISISLPVFQEWF